MYLETQHTIRQRFVQAVQEVFDQKISEPTLGFPPSVEMGDLSITSCFELAKQLRQAPRKIAEQIAPRLLPLKGVERVSIAGAGYLNFHLERAPIAASVFALRASSPPRPSRPDDRRKILVEHTSINPNKAAHIGHLRNGVLGDTFVRLLRFRDRTVEVQNYIDNTGVQVADVVVGFVHLETKSLDEVRKLIGDPAVRFDYYCWDLYARVFRWYEHDKEALAFRAEALRAIEDGQGEWGALADLISTGIVRLHLATMLRLGIEYDLLVQESEILKLDFWKSAFELMKNTGAVRYEDSGKNRGCWVMNLGESTEPESPEEAAQPETAEDVKVIVRSNGTVTYVGKDIAYHLWKFGLLGRDFGYKLFYRYPDGHQVWISAESSDPNPPHFGGVNAIYNVIDSRQADPQNNVIEAIRGLGHEEQARHYHHFSYEMVALTPRCADGLGYQLSPEDEQKSYIHVSVRKGFGVNADDVIE